MCAGRIRNVSGVWCCIGKQTLEIKQRNKMNYFLSRQVKLNNKLLI